MRRKYWAKAPFLGGDGNAYERRATAKTAVSLRFGRLLASRRVAKNLRRNVINRALSVLATDLRGSVCAAFAVGGKAGMGQEAVSGSTTEAVDHMLCSRRGYLENCAGCVFSATIGSAVEIAFWIAHKPTIRETAVNRQAFKTVQSFLASSRKYFENGTAAS